MNRRRRIINRVMATALRRGVGAGGAKRLTTVGDDRRALHRSLDRGAVETI